MAVSNISAGISRCVIRAVIALAVTYAGAAPASGNAAGGPSAVRSQSEQNAQQNSSDQGTDFHRLLKEGVLNNSLGRHSLAENAFRGALGICVSRFGHNSSKCADVQMRLALELSNQGRFEEADLEFGRSDELVKGSESALDRPRFLTYRAMDHANRNDFKSARRLINDANQRRKAILKTAFKNAATEAPDAKRKLDQTMTDLGHGLYVQASIAFRLGKLPEAKLTALLVRKLIAKTDSVPGWWIAFADALLADIHLREGNMDAAEKRLRMALKAKQVALGNTRAVALSYMALGRVFQESDRNSEALETSRPGLSILRGELRQAPGVDVDRLEPFLHAARETAKRVPARRDELYAEMFAAAQLARTSRTAKTVAQVAARFASDRPRISKLVSSLQYQTQLRDELRITLGRAMIKAAANRQDGQIGALKKSYVKAAAAVQVLERQLQAVFPKYADLVSPAPAGAREVAEILKPDEALVYFIFSDRGGYVFAARRSGVTVGDLGITRSELSDLIRKLREPFENVASRIAPYELDLAHRLYRRLLGPVEHVLTDVKHLIVASSSELLSLPFGLLVTKPVSQGKDPYRNAAWLIKKMAITQMPSVRSFATFRRTIRPSKARHPFIGFGDPVFEGKGAGAGVAALADHCNLGEPVPAALIRGLAALPDTAAELKSVAKALGAAEQSIFLGAAATEASVRGAALNQYRIVYFATHGLLPGELRCQAQPALALTPLDGATEDRTQDGILAASEIASLKLDADLVVLSACNTGGGGKLGGESLSGLARAFFQAGTRSVLVSHWQVDTVATTRLMTRTFDHVKSRKGRHLANALRHSQLDLLASGETAHPYFWAAFTLVGEGRQHVPPQVGIRP